jgi:hypothetical protein
MRRPGKTAAQRQYEREQRALLRLRRAAVRWSSLDEGGDVAEYAMVDTELQAASDAYANALAPRALRRLLK